MPSPKKQPRRSKKSKRGGPRPGSGRPKGSGDPAAARVMIPARVLPATLAGLRALAPRHGGVGHAIDALVSEKIATS